VLGSRKNTEGYLSKHRTTATATSFFRSPTASTRHPSGVRFQASSSSQDQQPTRPSPIPSQRCLTQQLSKHWAQFKVFSQLYAGTRFEEQPQLNLPQKHKATVPESTLRVEMNALEEQADNAKAHDLYWKPLSWLRTIRPSSANDAFDPALWETFFTSTIGLEVPVPSSLPRHHNNPLANAAAKNTLLHGLSRRPHKHVHRSLRCNQGARLDGGGPSPSVPHGWTHGPHPAWSHGNGAATWSFGTTCETRLAAEPDVRMFDLSIKHERYGSISHPLQNGQLTHPQNMDAPLHIAAEHKMN
jgi:hypothetical protein